MRRIYDLTLPVSDRLPVWPGDPVPEVVPASSLSAGDGFNVSTLRLGSHTGTHVDAPRHLFPKGAPVDQLPLDVLIGEAWVCRLAPSVRGVTREVLEKAGIPEGTRRLLLATGNSALWDRSPWSFTPDFVALAGDGAEWVVTRGILLLGIDYLSVDPAQGGEPEAHRALLSQGIVVVEGLDLRRVPQGSYHLCCLPLRLVDGDGAPARVVILDRSGSGGR